MCYCDGYATESRIATAPSHRFFCEACEPAHHAALVDCDQGCLDLAVQVGNVGLALFCAISTAMVGYPKEDVAHGARATVNTWVRAHPGALGEALFNVCSAADKAVYVAWLED